MDKVHSSEQIFTRTQYIIWISQNGMQQYRNGGWALKYWWVTHIVRPIDEIAQHREEATAHSVQLKWN